jgi:hypothetical protein
MRFDPDSECSRYGPSDALGPAIALVCFVGFFIILVISLPPLPQTGVISMVDLENNITTQINVVRDEYGLQPLIRVSKPLMIECVHAFADSTPMLISNDDLLTYYPIIVDPDIKYVYVNVKKVELELCDLYLVSVGVA